MAAAAAAEDAPGLLGVFNTDRLGIVGVMFGVAAVALVDGDADVTAGAVVAAPAAPLEPALPALPVPVPPELPPLPWARPEIKQALP